MICNRCKTEFGYVRLDSKEWVCRKCGKISKFKITEKVKPQPDIEVKQK